MVIDALVERAGGASLTMGHRLEHCLEQQCLIRLASSLFISLKWFLTNQKLLSFFFLHLKDYFDISCQVSEPILNFHFHIYFLPFGPSLQMDGCSRSNNQTSNDLTLQNLSFLCSETSLVRVTMDLFVLVPFDLSKTMSFLLIFFAGHVPCLHVPWRSPPLPLFGVRRWFLPFFSRTTITVSVNIMVKKSHDSNPDAGWGTENTMILI